MSVKVSKSNNAFNIINYTILTILGIITLYPLLNVLAISLSSYTAYLMHPLMIIPRKFTFEAYTGILSSPLLFSSYGNTIFVTLMGTFISLILTVMTAYPLAKSKIRGERVIMFFIVFTMLFNGGMIPTFLVVKNLNLIDTLWALIIPGAIGTTNLIIIRNFFESIPDSLEESAKIDGAQHLQILFKIIVPLSKPVLATIALFYGVAYWNKFFAAVIYINSRNNWTLPLLLREVITENTDVLNSLDPLTAERIYPKTMQSATIIITVLPILLIYPFLQKYFIKGIMIGAVKG